ncbi:MAG: HD-GYP domain-containing protein, partial [Gammaproteobacteria bacterium]|nr:HD-GYP domain-containing protein [Gammaproteobacteria bacterium]
MIIKKPVSQLEVGDFVVAIVEQKGNFKIKSSGFVQAQSLIEILKKKGVISVEVDTSKKMEEDEPLEDSGEGHDVEPIKESENDLSFVDKVSVEEPHLSKSAKYVEGLIKAKETFDEAVQVQSKILDDIKAGNSIDTEPVKSLVNDTIESIFENPESIACVINIRIKDKYLLEHSVSVSILMALFAKYLDLDRDLITQLATGAFLHDVGKIQVPEEILNKPGKLTYEEFEQMKLHVVYTREILESTKGINNISRSVASNHHEKLNGKGYPLGLKEEELSYFDKMITICDIYDALIAHRVYKQGLPQTKSFAILRELAKNGELDAGLVDKFIRCLGVYPVGSLVTLTTNKLGIVAHSNNDAPTKPMVTTFFDLENNHFIHA